MSAVRTLLSAAVDRVLADLERDGDGGLDGEVPGGSEASLRSAVREVADLLDRPDPGPPSLDDRPPAEKMVVRYAADRLRQALLQEAGTAQAEEALSLIRRLEALRNAAESGRSGGVAGQLSGHAALDLVIEVAHDLRSPLNSIMFLSETLRGGQSGPITDVQRQQLGIIYSAALGLLSVANDLMDMARDGDPAEAADFAAEPFSLAALLDSIHAMIRPMLEEKRLQLVFQLPRGDLRVGKPLPLSRALLNLLTNAIKFTDEGRIELVARETRGSRVEFSVRDSGRGMDPDTLRSLYEAFRQGATATGYRFSETGLGMALCRRMVGIMGGTLHVESERGRGTRFWFEIELPEAELVGSAGAGSGEEGCGQSGAGVERE